jgi:hypothetical protein
MDPAQSNRPSESLPVDLEQQIAQWRLSVQASMPAHVRALARVVRRSVETGRLNALDRWCKKRGLRLKRRQLRPFADFLITRLLELKDLEPDARARLRRDALMRQDASRTTEDYRRGFAAGEDLRCRDCRYFVTAPNEGDSTDASDSQSCVALGTKGADQACVGFVRSRQQGG